MTKQERGKLPEKFIVCLCNKSNSGKTQTLRNLAGILLSKPYECVDWFKPEENPPRDVCERPWDIIVEIVLKGKRCGICTRGDVTEEIKRDLPKMIKNNCKIIFCACRSRGTTANAVIKIAKDSKYTLVWTAPYTDNSNNKTLQEVLNRKKAEDLWGFIELHRLD